MTRFAKRPVFATLLILLGACKAPDSHPFDQYSTAVKNAGDSLDKVLVQETTWSRDDYIDQVLKGTVTFQDTALLDNKVGQLAVVFPASGQNKPTFYKLQDVRLTLSSMNQATQKYVGVLSVLASKDLIDPKTFETIAQDADSSLNSIAAKLKVQNGEVGIHVFSVASGEMLRLVAERRRHQALEKVLVESQPAIDAYARSCVRMVRTLDQSVWADYNKKAEALESAFRDLQKKSNGNLANDSQAKSIIEEHLQLNSDYITLVQSLKSAKEIYTKLPLGHQELLHSVQKKSTGFQAIEDLAEEGQRIKTIYDELQKTGSAGSKPAKAAKDEG